MNAQLKEFFFDEVDRRHLNFEAVSEYNTLMEQSQALFSSGDLPDEIVRLLDTANCISFAHGLKLGLKLNQWAAR